MSVLCNQFLCCCFANEVCYSLRVGARWMGQVFAINVNYQSLLWKDWADAHVYHPKILQSYHTEVFIDTSSRFFWLAHLNRTAMMPHAY